MRGTSDDGGRQFAQWQMLSASGRLCGPDDGGGSVHIVHVLCGIRRQGYGFAYDWQYV